MQEKKKTKIVATISDRMCDHDFIKTLYDSGMNVVRLNTAHQSPADTLKVIKSVREVSPKIGILVDTKGPEIRTTKSDEVVEVKAGDTITVKGDATTGLTKECLTVSYEHFVRDVNPGNSILIDDGETELRVDSKDDEKLTCTVMNDGVLKGKKSVNVPGVSINLPAISDKDLEYINFCIEHNVDFIAHSFVRRKEDLIAIQSILDRKNSKIKLIAKIENQEGVDKIDEIMEYAYGIMIARGDLAIEIPAEKIPYTQKMIIKKCAEKRKPVITATQMLHTMIDNPRPTRAEISDVANAVYDRTDALMLSGETAYGKYPIEALQTMARIAHEVETGIDSINEIREDDTKSEITAFLAKSAVKAASQLDISAIVIDTLTGRTARAISVYRGKAPIYAECYSEETVRELSLSYGVFPSYLNPQKTHVGFIENSLDDLLKKNIIERESRIVVVAGNFGPSRGASYIEIGTPNELLARC